MYTAVASPRGHAKSTIVCKAFPIWIASYHHSTNILVISDTAGQAESFLSDIRGEFEANDLLIEDFGDLTTKRKWSAAQIVTRNGVQISAKGSGTKIRGVNFNSVRPQIIVMDDMENDEAVESERSRKKLKTWLTKSVLPMSTPNGKFFLIGTVLHEDSLLNNLLHSSEFNAWKRLFYQAIQKFSDSPKWLEWETILLDTESGNSSDRAYSFYEQNREEMLEGVVALWMDRDKDYYYNMMVDRFQDIDAFSSEYQNIAIAPESRVFSTELIESCYYESMPCEIKEVFIGVDPSLGKSSSGDLSSIAVVGRGENNVLYLLETDPRRRKPEELIEDIFYFGIKYREYNPKINIEANVFQDFFYEQTVKECNERGFNLDFEPIKTSQDKETRIKTLIPKMKQGYFKIKRDQRMLVNEMAYFPKGKTDDILDSIYLAVNGVFSSSQVGFSSIGIRNRGINKNILGRRW